MTREATCGSKPVGNVHRMTATHQQKGPRRSATPDGGDAPARMPLRAVLLLHAAYWIAYVLLVTIILVVARGSARTSLLPVLFGSRVGLLLFAPNIAAFYVEYLVLVPRFLARKRIAPLAGWSVLAAFGATLACVFLPLAVAGVRVPLFTSLRDATGLLVSLTAVALVHMTVAAVMRGFIEWYNDIAVKEELRRRTDEVESALVRAKLDPHFLFNTLNNIDVLITRDPAAASRYVNELCSILRFVLYEARADRVPLASEQGYVARYVALQRIRIANPSFVSLSLVEGAGACTIAPMTLIPFVENAFKHAEGVRGDEVIAIASSIEGNRLTFTCRNRYKRGAAERSSPGGLGDDLVRRRLELLYPGRHAFAATDGDESYAVHLTIDLDDRALHHR